MKFIKLFAAAALALGSLSANATTVWQPTNNDADFASISFTSNSFNGYELYMFDGIAGFGDVSNSINIGDGAYLVDVDFSGNTAALGSDPLTNMTLSTGFQFTLGVTDNGTDFLGDVHIQETCAPGTIGCDEWLITFGTVEGGLITVEATVRGTDIVQAVPVPAALWLFGSGLLGLVGVARRRAA